jgi:hypothetical protein
LSRGDGSGPHEAPPERGPLGRQLGRLLDRLLFWRRRAGRGQERPVGYDLIGSLEQDLDASKLPPPRQQVAHASLLESLRALATDLPVPTVVIAGIESEDSARAVIAGINIQAHLHGLRLVLAKLVPQQGHRVLRKRVPRTETSSTSISRDETFDSHGPAAMGIEMVGAPDPAVLREWYERAAEGNDLLIVEAPPMLRSVDAALLGRACDGLVLVIKALATKQEDLEAAVEKARAAGCPPIGLVIADHSEWLPRTLRKFLPAYPRSVKPRRPPPSPAAEGE